MNSQQRSVTVYVLLVVSIIFVPGDAESCWWHAFDEVKYKVCQIQRQIEKQTQLCREESWLRCDHIEPEQFERDMDFDFAIRRCWDAYRAQCMARNGLTDYAY